MVYYMKKIILYLLVAVLSAAPVSAFAQETAQTPETAITVQETKNMKMSVSDAVSYALENAPSVVAAELNLKYYEEVYAQSRSTWASMVTKTAQSDEMYLIKSGYRLSQAEMGVKVAERSLNQAITSTKAGVYQNFYTYLSNVEKVEIAKSALSQAESRLEQANAKYSTGAVSQLDIDTFETNVLSAKNALAQAERACEISMETLKNYLGVPKDTVLEVSGKLELNESIKLVTLDEAKSLVEEKNSDILAIKESMELEDRMMGIYDSWYTSNTFTYRVQKAAYEQKIQGYQTQLDTLRLSVSQVYNAVLTANESYELLNSKYENTKKSFEVAKAQYDMGMMSATDFIDVSQQFTSLENSILDMKVNVILATNSYLSLYNEDYVEITENK